MRKGSFVSALLFGIALTLLFTWFSVFFGLYNAARDVRRILYYVRMPRALEALFSGTALGASGYLIQKALHNTFASPSVMGVNVGTGLFAPLAALLFPAVATARFVSAFFGALLSVLLVLLIARRAGYSQSVIALSGVAISTLMGAAVNGLVTFFPHAVTDRQAFTLGSFANLQYDGLFFSAIFILPGLLAGALLGGDIDFFALGDEVAQGLGLSVTRHRPLTMVTATVFVVAAVCVNGLIGFLSPAVPGVLRRFPAGRISARQIFVLSGLYGSVLLITADFLARRLFYPYELPIELLLNLLGAPFFIWMLTYRRRGI